MPEINTIGGLLTHSVKGLESAQTELLNLAQYGSGIPGPKPRRCFASHRVQTKTYVGRIERARDFSANRLGRTCSHGRTYRRGIGGPPVDRNQ